MKIRFNPNLQKWKIEQSWLSTIKINGFNELYINVLFNPNLQKGTYIEQTQRRKRYLEIFKIQVVEIILRFAAERFLSIEGKSMSLIYSKQVQKLPIKT